MHRAKPLLRQSGGGCGDSEAAVGRFFLRSILGCVSHVGVRVVCVREASVSLTIDNKQQRVTIILVDGGWVL